MDAIIKPWYKKWWGVVAIIAIVFFLGLILALGTFFIKLVVSSMNGEILPVENIQTGYVSESERKLIEGENNYWFGSANPKIVIVEFADFACPVCHSAFTTIRPLVMANQDIIKHIYRDYPVISDSSLSLAQSARCAGEQGLFWPMHDKLFQSQGISDSGEINTLAGRIGLDMNKYKTCIDSGKYLDNIQKDIIDAQALGVNGTPTWFINGQRIEGDIPANIFQQIIDQF